MLLATVACGGAQRAQVDDGLVTGLEQGESGADDDGLDGGATADDASATTAAVSSGDESSTGDEAPYADIARIAMPTGWTVEADGSWTFPDVEPSPFVALGQAFYADHGDDYDFLAVYTEGVLLEFWALAVTVRYDIGGIGLPQDAAWIDPSDAGSAGRLQQIDVMNAPWQYAPDPSDADVLVHETTHRWAAFVELGGTPEPAYLLDAGWAHWNIHVHGGGPSATGYGDVVDLDGGSFRFDLVRPWKLSPLELYLAGLVPADEVAPMFYVASPYGHDPAIGASGEAIGRATLAEPCTFSGVRTDFTVADIVAANGPRVPAVGEAQTHFRFAFVLACVDPDACSESDLAIVEAQRTAFPATWSAATGGRSTVDTAL
jgi:hypothetical protein